MTSASKTRPRYIASRAIGLVIPGSSAVRLSYRPAADAPEPTGPTKSKIFCGVRGYARLEVHVSFMSPRNPPELFAITYERSERGRAYTGRSSTSNRLRRPFSARATTPQAHAITEVDSDAELMGRLTSTGRYATAFAAPFARQRCRTAGVADRAEPCSSCRNRSSSTIDVRDFSSDRETASRRPCQDSTSSGRGDLQRTGALLRRRWAIKCCRGVPRDSPRLPSAPRRERRLCAAARRPAARHSRSASRTPLARSVRSARRWLQTQIARAARRGEEVRAWFCSGYIE